MSTQPYVGDPDWPENFGGCRVTATYIDFYARPLEGSVTFKPSVAYVKSPATKRILISTQFEVELDANGSISILLPASDDTDVTPTGWKYAVTENFPGGRSYTIDAPVGQTIDLVDVSEV